MTCQMNHQRRCKKITQQKYISILFWKWKIPSLKWMAMLGNFVSHSAPAFKLVQQPLRLVFSASYDLQGDLVYFTLNFSFTSLDFLYRTEVENWPLQRRWMSSGICEKMGQKARNGSMTDCDGSGLLEPFFFGDRKALFWDNQIPSVSVIDRGPW